MPRRSNMNRFQRRAVYLPNLSHTHARLDSGFLRELEQEWRNQTEEEEDLYRAERDAVYAVRDLCRSQAHEAPEQVQDTVRETGLYFLGQKRALYSHNRRGLYWMNAFHALRRI